MLHSTAGMRQLRCYSERGRAFAEAGVAALQFDCRGFGASEGEPRQLLDVRMLAEDLEAAIELAGERDELDSGRLGLWGGSASCAQVLAAARGRAGVAGGGLPHSRSSPDARPSAPPARPSSGSPPRLPAIAANGLRAGAARGGGRRRAGRDRDPRPRGRCGRRAGDAAARGPGRSLGRPGRARTTAPSGRTGSSSAPDCARHTLCGSRPSVGCPVLVVAGSEDRLCPPGPAAELARRAPAGELADLRVRPFRPLPGEKHRGRGGVPPPLHLDAVRRLGVLANAAHLAEDRGRGRRRCAARRRSRGRPR